MKRSSTSRVNSDPAGAALTRGSATVAVGIISPVLRDWQIRPAEEPECQRLLGLRVMNEADLGDECDPIEVAWPTSHNGHRVRGVSCLKKKRRPRPLVARGLRNRQSYLLGQVVETTFTFVTVKVDGAPDEAAAPLVLLSSLPQTWSRWPTSSASLEVSPA